MARFMAERTGQAHSRNWLQERTTPHRRTSVIVSINEGTVNAPATLTNITDTALTRSPNTVPAHARRVSNEIVASTDEAWRTVEEALSAEQQRATTRGTTAHAAATDSNPTAPELRSELRRIRQLTQARERPSLNPMNSVWACAGQAARRTIPD